MKERIAILMFALSLLLIGVNAMVVQSVFAQEFKDSIQDYHIDDFRIGDKFDDVKRLCITQDMERDEDYLIERTDDGMNIFVGKIKNYGYDANMLLMFDINNELSGVQFTSQAIYNDAYECFIEYIDVVNELLEKNENLVDASIPWESVERESINETFSDPNARAFCRWTLADESRLYVTMRKSSEGRFETLTLLLPPES